MSRRGPHARQRRERFVHLLLEWIEVEMQCRAMLEESSENIDDDELLEIAEMPAASLVRLSSHVGGMTTAQLTDTRDFILSLRSEEGPSREEKV